jgi:hypothetical protein
MALESMSPESTDEQQQQQLQSPVGVVVSIRKELAEFQRTNIDKEVLRRTLREMLRAACNAALRQGAVADYPDIAPLVEYLKQRGQSRSDSRQRKLASRRLINSCK